MSPARTTALAAALLAALAAAPAAADRVVTLDGRVLTPKKARAEGGGYRLVFEHGELVVADKSQLSSVEVEGDMSDYVPQNEDERKKLEQGYVRYQGKWLSRAAYEAELQRVFQKGRERTEMLRAHAEFDNGWTKETAHFAFRTNTSPELLDYYAELLEAYHDLMDKRIGIDPTPSLRRTKMQVNVYRSYPEFRKLAPYGAGEVPYGVIGFFSPGDKSLNFYHDYEEPSRSTWVALHECTHLLTYLVDPQYVSQIWVNEGVADYFGSSRVTRDKRGKLVIEPGHVQTDRVLTVQQAIDRGSPKTASAEEAGGGQKSRRKSEGRGDIKLEELFLIDREDFHGFEYAHAWSFVYFLNNFENGRHRKAFDKFFKGLYTLEKGIPYETIPYGPTGAGKRVAPQDIRAYLLKRLGVKETEQIERDWKTFIAAVAIDAPEARLKRGLRSLGEFDFEEALADLDAAIEGGIRDARAWAGRGQAKAFRDGPAEGVDDLKKAIELDPLTARYHYLLSQFLAGRIAMSGGGLGGVELRVESDGEKIDHPEARAAAGLATELDPDNDRYREWFAEFQ